MTLAQESCVPCSSDVPPLSAEQAANFLKALPDWSLRPDGSAIERTFRFKSFSAALRFVEQVAALAEENDHHPDITFGWGYCTVTFTTHRIKGLHRNDFIMAARVDALSRS